jgi:8-oxo-dGTP diphosphatase
MKIRPAACIIKDKKILLMRYRYGGVDVFNLPGGNLDFGEYMANCVERELYEELNVKVKASEILLFGEMKSRDNTENILHFIFSTEIIDGEPIINKNETSALEVVWIKLEDLPNLKMYPLVGQQLLNKLQNPNNEAFIGEINQVWY